MEDTLQHQVYERSSILILLPPKNGNTGRRLRPKKTAAEIGYGPFNQPDLQSQNNYMFFSLPFCDCSFFLNKKKKEKSGV